MGLAALHISEGREYPLFFYGQSYMGTIEAYLAAPMFWIFGPSVHVQRVPVLALYVVFALSLYTLTRIVYGPWLAAVTSVVLAAGSDRTVKNQLIAAGGYPEISPGATLLILLATMVGIGLARPRPALLATWGLVAGLLFWDHWLILPYVAAAGIVMFAALRGRRGDTRMLRAAGFVVGGFVLGALPLLIANVTRPLSENSISVFLEQSSGGASVSFADRLHDGVVQGIPMGIGMCAPSRCEAWQVVWALPYVLMLCVAGTHAYFAVRRLHHAMKLIQAVRLALVVAAVVSIVAYARSSAATSDPVESARYLSPLLISTPAVLWPAWALAGRLWRPLGDGRQTSRALLSRIGKALVVVYLGAQLVATGQLIGIVGSYREEGRRHDALARFLIERDSLHIYSDYWTCNLVVFATQEKVKCAVISDSLGRGLDRYMAYRRAVDSAPRVVYVAPAEAGLAQKLDHWFSRYGSDYQTGTVADYRIYIPDQPVPLPADS